MNVPKCSPLYYATIIVERKKGINYLQYYDKSEFEGPFNTFAGRENYAIANWLKLLICTLILMVLPATK